MKPYYEHAGITIYHGDCREVLPSLVADSAGLALTDPPYNVGKSYGDHDDSQEHDCYVGWLSGVLRECSRVSRDGVVYFPGQIMRNVLSIGPMLAGAGLSGYRMLGWHKKEFAGDKWHTGPAFCWEPVVWASKQPRPFFNKRFGHAGRDFLVVNSTHGDPFKKRHPCPKPMPVMRWLVGLFALDGLPVLDPFMGTGTTLRAAKDAGLPAIGIELEERYCELAAKRLSQGVLFGSEADRANPD